jgi:hypothetical protein
MYAEIPNSLVAKKSPRIEINKVYELQRFKILPAKSLYKAVDSPVMIQFTIYTQANIVRDPPSLLSSTDLWTLIKFQMSLVELRVLWLIKILTYTYASIDLYP